MRDSVCVCVREREEEEEGSQVYLLTCKAFFSLSDNKLSQMSGSRKVKSVENNEKLKKIIFQFFLKHTPRVVK